jgi:nucleotide-binding universal stress UspA family protein
MSSSATREATPPWRTVALDLTPGGQSEGVRQAAAVLVERFDAALLGLAAVRPVNAIAGDGYADGDIIADERDALQGELNSAEAAFRTQVAPAAPLHEWRGTVGAEAGAAWIAQEARGADLLIAAPDHGGLLRGTSRVKLADLVMAAGRPVLIAPAGRRPLALGTAVLAWKDTRETRRAAADAVPLLQACRQVIVITIARAKALKAARAELAPVATWLARHGVRAEIRAERARRSDAARLAQIVGELEADILVAGAYGRPRLREWTLGGVTSDYLLDPDRCVLLSH